VPAYDLAEVKAKAEAALSQPAILVEWNVEKTLEPVSARLDMTFVEAMTFILEEVGRLAPACYSQTLRQQQPHADVYRHDARRCEWYVKFALARQNRLLMLSFHPCERPVRVAHVPGRLR
jgi:hypothetical protein